MPVYKPDGTQLLLDNWSKSIVCEEISEGIFVSRSLLLQHKISLLKFGQFEFGTGAGLSVELDDRNVITKTVNVTNMFMVLIALFFGAMESTVGYTPGKWFLGLKVLTLNGSLPNLGQGLLRSTIKYLGFWLVFLVAPVSNVLFDGNWILLLAGQGAVINADEFPFGVMITSLLLVFLLLFAIQASILLPWKRSGRALYDRLAGTIVARV